MAIISIPPMEDYRGHLKMVLTFLSIHFQISPLLNIPTFGFEVITSQETLGKLLTKLSKAKKDKAMKISLAEALTLYTCFVFMNKILVSKYDEVVSSQFLSMLPEGHYLKKFETFRDEMIYINSHLIENSELKLGVHEELFALKEKLIAIEID